VWILKEETDYYLSSYATAYLYWSILTPMSDATSRSITHFEIFCLSVDKADALFSPATSFCSA
jgi:hypothetical protein